MPKNKPGPGAGEAEQDEQARRDDLDNELDQELEQTFPASDPLTLTRARPPRKQRGKSDAGQG